MEPIDTDYIDINGNRIYTGDRMQVSDGYEQNTSFGTVKIRHGMFVIVDANYRMIAQLGVIQEHGGCSIYQTKV